MNENTSIPSVNDICFGLNRITDERSLKCFLKLFTSDELLETLIPRLSDDEITSLVDVCTKLMGRHMSKKEYHHLMLKQPIK